MVDNSKIQATKSVNSDFPFFETDRIQNDSAISKTETLKNKVLSGKDLSVAEAGLIPFLPLKELLDAANEIRLKFTGKSFDLCSIVNAKSGRCSENCKYCAQSSHYKTRADEYPLLSKKILLDLARKDARRGVLRFSFVTSGKKLDPHEIDQLSQAARMIRQETDLSICISAGLLDENDFLQLKEAGISRYHHNLETSRGNFPKICSTHSYDDKLTVIGRARKAGLEICCGFIVGLGENWSDRIDLAFELKRLNVRSVPINRLTPIPGTPLEHDPVPDEETMLRTGALFRFILPKAAIRLAGGRKFSEDQGRTSFQGGVNACITGDMLTTAGISIENDLNIIRELGFHPEKII